MNKLITVLLVCYQIYLANQSKQYLSNAKIDKDFQIQQSQSNDDDTSIIDILVVYWCGFGEEFCGNSNQNDVNKNATHVILSFLKVQEDGSIYHGQVPNNLIRQWQSNGKKVLISIRGIDDQLDLIFQQEQSQINFVQSLNIFVNKYNLDGVDMQILQYKQTPAQVISLFSDLRSKLGQNQLLFLTIDNLAVYPSQLVPNHSLETQNQSWNYFVPIYIENPILIDYIQVLAYRNDYFGKDRGSADYMVQIIKGWLNIKQNYQIPGFMGIQSEQLIITVLSTQNSWFGQNSAFYISPSNIRAALNQLIEQDINIKGISLWNSHYDKNNNYEMSNLIVDYLNEKTLNEEYEGEEEGEVEGEEDGENISFEGEEQEIIDVDDDDDDYLYGQNKSIFLYKLALMFLFTLIQ
ncbi:Glycoside hydrolase, superfamily [Pseudocohnilembus persalinus]|uniref:Glycoside hydrolase, superfamily n=1 Tax=Pseudocohnilembus persalinus TaxID=266149 RepID=A0A0V0QK83_PSEPJ|nr:Glycoside hydrolase, superfamily [Pseudocohnilembus persalinus]|eukprot:KRX02619.1 Glycoside hydrolase, superfamily [Pseudocohnilembus persalinus]